MYTQIIRPTHEQKHAQWKDRLWLSRPEFDSRLELYKYVGRRSVSNIGNKITEEGSGTEVGLWIFRKFNISE